MAKTKHGLPETKGSFKLVGTVTGVRKEDFFGQKPTKKEDLRNTVKFGVKTSSENEIPVQIADQERDSVYFFRREDKDKGIEKNTKAVPWADRKSFEEEGYQLIGTNIGIEKVENEKGKMVNDKKSLHPFDAAEYLDHLATEGVFKDEMPIRAMGDIEFSSFDSNDGKIRFKRFTANKIYNSQVDFEADDFLEESDFKQKFVYMSTEMKKEDGTNYAIVSGKIVTYSTIEDVEFIIRNKKLATNFQKKLKPYTSIVVFGKVFNKAIVEEVEASDDDWGGEADPFDNAYSSRKLEMEITGIKTDDIDVKTYTEANIREAMRADEEFGADVDNSGDDWDKDGDGGDDGWD